MSVRAPLRVAIIGAGGWAQKAHIPSFQKCEDARIVALCDANKDLAGKVANRFHIPHVYEDYQELLEKEEIDAVDVCASAVSHFEIASEAIRRKKSVLCEKPLAQNLEQARLLQSLAEKMGVKTKMGFTYRYSPALRYFKELVDEGFVGQKYLFNGFEQNSQFIDPKTPFRWNPAEDSSKIMTGSLEEYAPHLIDIALWLMGGITSVTGRMRNFVPERLIRDLGKSLPINIEDATVWLADFEDGAMGTFQSSFIAIGGYPGMEVRLYGSKGAIIARLVEEFSVHETVSIATPDRPEFRLREIPDRFYPNGFSKQDHWIELYFGNLVRSFVREVLENKIPEAGFADGARAQEVEDAVYLSHLNEQAVKLPL
jgi:predicted dehydrogenase